MPDLLPQIMQRMEIINVNVDHLAYAPNVQVQIRLLTLA
jgi:hypothetical protein